MPGQLVVIASSSQIQAMVQALQEVATAVRSQPFWNTQWFAATVGALVGLTPSLYLLHKDRAIIRVTFGHILMSVGANQRIRSGLWMKIANSGRRPITVEDVFLQFASGETLIFLDDSLFVGGRGLPKTLQEGNAHSVNLLAGSLAPEVLEKGHYPVAVCFRDALGRVYKREVGTEFWETFFKTAASRPDNT